VDALARSVDLDRRILPGLDEAGRELGRIVAACRKAVPVADDTGRPERLKQLLSRYTMEVERVVHESAFGADAAGPRTLRHEDEGGVELFDDGPGAPGGRRRREPDNIELISPRARGGRRAAGRRMACTIALHRPSGNPGFSCHAPRACRSHEAGADRGAGTLRGLDMDMTAVEARTCPFLSRRVNAGGNGETGKSLSASRGTPRWWPTWRRGGHVAWHLRACSWKKG
jgi:hypothetical protein